jgi:hypothetical protein
MRLEAAQHHFGSTRFTLWLDEQPIGTMLEGGFFFGRNLTLQLHEYPPLRFRKTGWFTSRFELQEEAERSRIGAAFQPKMLLPVWHLESADGEGEMRFLGQRHKHFGVMWNGCSVAEGHCQDIAGNRWIIDFADERLSMAQVLLIGSVYHIAAGRIGYGTTAPA